MSSIKYQDKDLSELKKLLQSYRENFSNSFGHDPDLVSLKLKLNDLANRKKEELFGSLFGSLTAKSLKDCCSVIDKDFLGFKEEKPEAPPSKKKK